MKLVCWKTVQSREGKPDDFYISFGKLPATEFGKPLFLFACSEKDAREAFGEEIDKIKGLSVVHPIQFTLSMREEENE